MLGSLAFPPSEGSAGQDFVLWPLPPAAKGSVVSLLRCRPSGDLGAELCVPGPSDITLLQRASYVAQRVIIFFPLF